jgi:hypothetical protein
MFRISCHERVIFRISCRRRGDSGACGGAAAAGHRGPLRPPRRRADRQDARRGGRREHRLGARPVRRARSYAGQRHYPRLFWSATPRGYVVYESRLELDRLLLADFDPDVAWLTTQPMWLSGVDGAKTRRHVPDLLMRLRGGYLVADVKPAEFAARPEVAEVLAWTGRARVERGWRYEVLGGTAPVPPGNLRFLDDDRV